MALCGSYMLVSMQFRSPLITCPLRLVTPLRGLWSMWLSYIPLYLSSQTATQPFGTCGFAFLFPIYRVTAVLLSTGDPLNIRLTPSFKPRSSYLIQCSPESSYLQLAWSELRKYRSRALYAIRYTPYSIRSKLYVVRALIAKLVELDNIRWRESSGQ